jgi:parvulin-like peptidyl-prolyl isomerase
MVQRIAHQISEFRAVARLGCALALTAAILFTGCQTPQMRNLRKMGVLPEDISDRIAREQGGPIGSTGHTPPEPLPAESKSGGIFSRGAEPEAPPTNTDPGVSPIPSVSPDRGSNESKQEKTNLTKTNLLDIPTLAERANHLGRKHDGGHVVATVNGTAILEEELRLAQVQSGAEDALNPNRRRQALNTLIDREVAILDAESKLGKSPQGKKFLEKMYEYGGKEFTRYTRIIKEKNKFENEDELKAMFRQSGVSYELMRRQTERNFVSMQYLQQRVMPAMDRIGHRDLREYYDGHPELFKIQDSVNWRHIFIAKVKFKTPEEARKQAEEVVQKIKAGEDFVTLSRKYCHGDSALRDGDGLGHTPGEIRPVEAEPILLSMKEGEVADVLELPTGYHIIQLTKRQYAGMKPFNEVAQKEIRDKLRNEVATLEIKRLLAEMKRNAVIEIMPDS